MLSIIIPIYNNEKKLARCIESVILTQCNLEVILVDDGSLDSSLEICHKYAKQYNNIKVISQENQGVSAARNKGIQMASGKWIGFVDSDDWVENDYFERMSYVAEQGQTDLVMAGYSIDNYSVRGSLIGSGFSAVETARMLLTQNTIGGYCWNKLFKKEILIKYNITFDSTIKVCEDMLFTLQYIQHITSSCFLEDKLYHYDISDNTGKYSAYKVYSAVTAYEMISQLPMISSTAKLRQLTESNIVKHCIKTVRVLQKENCWHYDSVRPLQNKVRRHLRSALFCRALPVRYKGAALILATWPDLLKLF